jgi:hypothetical protein
LPLLAFQQQLVTNVILVDIADIANRFLSNPMGSNTFDVVEPDILIQAVLLGLLAQSGSGPLPWKTVRTPAAAAAEPEAPSAEPEIIPPGQGGWSAEVPAPDTPKADNDLEVRRGSLTRPTAVIGPHPTGA